MKCLKSENANPSGTCTVYLSYAEMDLPPKTASVIAKCRARCRDHGQNTIGIDGVLGIIILLDWWELR